MEVEGAVVVVTGGGHGIGRAMCLRFAEEGARAVVVVDLDEDAARSVAADCHGVGIGADVAVELEVERVLEEVEALHGAPNLFCANAGIGADGELDAPDELWERSWRVNVLSHVYAARRCIPRMLRNGGGHLLHTASAAGLLSMPGAAPYAVSKHGAVAVAEYLAMTYGSQGIGVSCLCPQAVDTRLLRDETAEHVARTMRAVSPVLTPEDVAEAVVVGLREERFLILPHPEVAEHERRRAVDRDRWLAGMRRISDGMHDDPR